MDYVFNLTSTELKLFNYITDCVNKREKEIVYGNNLSSESVNKVCYRITCYFFNKLNLFVCFEKNEDNEGTKMLHYSTIYETIHETIDVTEILKKHSYPHAIGIKRSKLFIDKTIKCIPKETNYKLLMDPNSEEYLIIIKI